MSIRKRQRPSARDFFDHPPPVIELVQEPAQESALIADFKQSCSRGQHLQEYYSALVTLDPLEQILELIRGRDKLDSLDSSACQAFIFIFKSQDSYHRFPHPIDHVLKPSHIARILWGPGKKEAAHGKEIYLGPLCLSVDQGQTLTTEEIYGIQFSNQRSADIAAQIIEFKLNQFFLSEHQDILVQVKNGSFRWFGKDKNKSMSQSDWKIEKTKIPFLRPLPSLKSNSSDGPSSNQKSTQLQERFQQQFSFEISGLPKTLTIPILMKNLFKLQLLDFPVEIKSTEETTTDLPIRILLKFSNAISTKICKLSLFHRGLNYHPDGQNYDDNDTKIHQFIIDQGDSSIEDSWNIWKSALVWDQHSIEDFIKHYGPDKFEEGDHQQDDEKLDQLADEKVDGFGSDEFEEWVSSNPTGRGADETSRRSRTREKASYQQILEENQRAWKKELERLTLLADQEYIDNQESSNAARVQISNPNSAFYQVSQRVLEDKQFHNLMNLMKTRSHRRKLTREYRTVKPLSKKIKRQRRAWRNGDPEADDNDETDTEEEEVSAGSQSSEPDERQRASFSGQQWKRFRHKKRSQRLLDPTPSSDEENDNEIVSKSLLTNDQIYQHKFSRPNEQLPGDVR